MNLESLAIVQKTMNFQILLILKENDGLKREDVYSKLVGSRDTKRTRVNELISEGLISEERKYIHNVKELHITTKGIQIANYASKINEILSEGKSEDPQPATGVINSTNLSDTMLDYSERPYASKLLIALHDAGMTMQALVDKFSDPVIKDRLNEAKQLDLIEELHFSGPQSEIKYYLTAEGITAAKNMMKFRDGKEVVQIDYETSSREENMARR